MSKVILILFIGILVLINPNTATDKTDNLPQQVFEEFEELLDYANDVYDIHLKDLDILKEKIFKHSRMNLDTCQPFLMLKTPELKNPHLKVCAQETDDLFKLTNMASSKGSSLCKRYQQLNDTYFEILEKEKEYREEKNYMKDANKLNNWLTKIKILKNLSEDILLKLNLDYQDLLTVNDLYPKVENLLIDCMAPGFVKIISEDRDAENKKTNDD